MFWGYTPNMLAIRDQSMAFKQRRAFIVYRKEEFRRQKQADTLKNIEDNGHIYVEGTYETKQW